MARTFSGSGLMPLALTKCPRNSTVEAINLHLFFFARSPASESRCSTASRDLSWASSVGLYRD